MLISHYVVCCLCFVVDLESDWCCRDLHWSLTWIKLVIALMYKNLVPWVHGGLKYRIGHLNLRVAVLQLVLRMKENLLFWFILFSSNLYTTREDFLNFTSSFKLLVFFFVCVNDNPIVDAKNLQLMCCIMCYNNRVSPNNSGLCERKGLINYLKEYLYYGC
jgi:hypothetical protein